MDDKNSLKPVPPGSTRVSLGYCAECKAARCVFLPGMERLPVRRKRYDTTEAKKKGYQRAAAHKRAKGLASNGQPLKRSCWNCDKLCRVDGTGYICPFDPDDLPLTASVMRNRCHRVKAEKCASFGMRLVVDIPEWGEGKEKEDGADNG